MSRHRPGGARLGRAHRPRPTSALSCFLVLALFCISAMPGEAQTQVGGPVTERIVVTADFEELPTDEVGSAVTTIDRAEIERRGYRTVHELLRFVPGVEVTRGGGPGKVTSVRIRGGDASQTLVLIDGVRVNDATTGDFDFADLLTDNVERVEVVRGPQAIWGSEAVSGVVAITTRRGQPGRHFGGAVEIGSDDLRYARFDASGSGERADYSVSIGRFATDGVSHNSERAGNTEVDPYENTTVVSRVGVELGEDGRLDLVGRYVVGENELDGFLDDDPNAQATREAVTFSATWRQQVTARFTQTVLLAGSDTNLLGEDPDSPFNNYDIDARTVRLESRSSFRASETATLTGGLSAERREGVNSGSFDEDADLHAGFLHARWALRGRYFLTAAARLDDHSTFGSEVTWRGTGSFAFPASRTRLHASAGTAFRAPDFNELFFPFAGNTGLRPETSEGFDLGVEQSWFDEKLVVDATWFRHDHDDLIDFDLETFTFRNIARAISEGLELELRARPVERLELRLGHTWNEAEDRDSGLPLPRRPEHRSHLVASVQASERVQGTLSMLAVRDRVDSTGLAMDDYERVDLAFDYRAHPRLWPYLRFENLFDEDYEEVTGFTTPGFTAAVGLSIKP
jgi:vitamin B12 transporter